jgi:hypothetical protein
MRMMRTGGSAKGGENAAAGPRRSGSPVPSSRAARCSKIGSSRHHGPAARPENLTYHNNLKGNILGAAT